MHNKKNSGLNNDYMYLFYLEIWARDTELVFVSFIFSIIIEQIQGDQLNMAVFFCYLIEK